MAPLNMHIWLIFKILFFELMYRKVDLSLFQPMNFRAGLDLGVQIIVTITTTRMQNDCTTPQNSQATDL